MIDLNHPFIGPEFPFGTRTCGYNSGSNDNFDPTLGCNNLGDIHFRFDMDENHGGLTCSGHRPYIPNYMISHEHQIDTFCVLEGSVWDFELNLCVMPLEYYEKQLLGEVISVEELDNSEPSTMASSRGLRRTEPQCIYW